MAPSLTRHVRDGVALLGDDARPGGVTLVFTERTGGVSQPPYASLNLGSHCGDDPAAVAENRARALAAAGAADIAHNLVEPKQVHGDHIVIIHGNGMTPGTGSSMPGSAVPGTGTLSRRGRVADGPAPGVTLPAPATPAELECARAEAQAGADAIVCTAAGVPVLLCFADCVPVVIAAPGAFAVIHSGWRGTFARISAKALRVLCEEAGCGPRDVSVYIGPHIEGEDYEVSEELLDRFVAEFGTIVHVKGMLRYLSLTNAIVSSLVDAGVKPCQIADARVSTATHVDRFFSYRAEAGKTGRHAAIAYL